jgi:hypothetical protein
MGNARMWRLSKPMGGFALTRIPWRTVRRGFWRSVDLTFDLALIGFGGGVTVAAAAALRETVAALARIGSVGHPERPLWGSAVAARHWLIAILAAGLILTPTGAFEFRAWLRAWRRKGGGDAA